MLQYDHPNNIQGNQSDPYFDNDDDDDPFSSNATVSFDSAYIVGTMMVVHRIDSWFIGLMHTEARVLQEKTILSNKSFSSNKGQISRERHAHSVLILRILLYSPYHYRDCVGSALIWSPASVHIS